MIFKKVSELHKFGKPCMTNPPFKEYRIWEHTKGSRQDRHLVDLV